MSRPGVWLADTLNQLVPPLAMHRELDTDKLSVQQYQAREYKEAQRVCPEFGPLWDVSGKRLLDVGSGLGGKPAYYADLGAASVTGIDIRPLSVEAAAVLARGKHTRRLRWLLADAAAMPFPDDSFDAIVSINVLEHVANLRQVLAECRRVLRQTGLMFFHFPPFYSPWGAHLEGWVHYPWPHVVFSDRTLIEVARRAEGRQRNNSRFIHSAQVDWAQLDRLPDLNRATLREVRQLLDDLNLRVVEAHLLPVGRHYLQRHGRLGQAALAMLNQVTNWPVLREVLTTKMVFVLDKGDPQ